MNRRTFLASMLAACAAPAIVRADSLMRIVARDALVVPVDYRACLIDSTPRSFDEIYDEVVRYLARQVAETIDNDAIERLTRELIGSKFPSALFPLVQSKRS